MNRNKKSITLNLKKPEGLEILQKLVQEADVLIESFRPQASQKLGITYDRLREINSRIIVCSLSGYGQHGPHANIAGHDLNFAGLTGVLAAGTEQVLPIQAMDFGGAYLAAFAVVTAIYQRVQTGEGTAIDTALLDSGLSMMTLVRADAFARQTAPKGGGEVLTGGYACYRVYRTADGLPLVLAALEPQFWQTFCTLMGRSDLAQCDYLTEEIQPELIADIEREVASRTHEECMELLDGNDTCATPMLNVIEAAEHKQVQFREALYMADGVAHTRTPFHMGDRITHQSAPALGEHTTETLMSIGILRSEIDQLSEEGII